MEGASGLVSRLWGLDWGFGADRCLRCDSRVVILALRVRVLGFMMTVVSQ